jgi:hypothetical protein
VTGDGGPPAVARIACGLTEAQRAYLLGWLVGASDPVIQAAVTEGITMALLVAPRRAGDR